MIGMGTDRSIAWAPRLGLSIGADRILAVRRSRFGTSHVALERPLHTRPSMEAGWPELELALQDLLAELRISHARADIALLPPLARTKRIDTPPVSPSKVDALLSRNLRRYFAVPFVSPIGRVRPVEVLGRKVTRALAVCADAHVVNAICRAAEGAGVTPTSLTSGHSSADSWHRFDDN